MDLFNLKKIKRLEETVKSLAERSLVASGRPVFIPASNFLQGNIFAPGWLNDHTETYCSNDDVYSVISKIAEKMATAPLYAYTKTTDKKAFKSYCLKAHNDLLKRVFEYKALKPLPDTDDLSMLLEQPNPRQSGHEFFQLGGTLYLLHGEVFIYKRKTGADRGSKTKELHIFSAPDTAIKITGAFPYEIVSYEFSYGGGEILKNVPPEDVIHIKMPNPKFSKTGEHLRGLSPLKPGKKRIELLDAANQRGESLLKNGGVPGIIYVKDADSETPSYEEFKKQYQSWIDNPDNTGAPMPASGDIGHIPLGMKIADIGLMELQNMSFKKLCNIYHVSDVVFNSDASSTESNVKEMRREMYTDAVIPLADVFQDALNKGLISDGTKFIGFDFSEIPELQADLQKQMSAISAMPVAPTGNEQRAMLRYEAIEMPEMNVPLIKSGYMPIDQTGALPDPENPEDANQ